MALRPINAKYQVTTGIAKSIGALPKLFNAPLRKARAGRGSITCWSVATFST